MHRGNWHTDPRLREAGGIYVARQDCAGHVDPSTMNSYQLAPESTSQPSAVTRIDSSTTAVPTP
jgi:hypothetical protein